MSARVVVGLVSIAALVLVTVGTIALILTGTPSWPIAPIAFVCQVAIYVVAVRTLEAK